MSGTRVTATDVDSGYSETAVIENDYVVICDGTAHITSITRHGNGTTIVRIKNRPGSAIRAVLDEGPGRTIQ